MSKTRKILSIVLAVVMAFGVFSICAFADTPTAVWTIEVTNLDGSALPATIPVGGQVKVTVKLQTNFYIGTVGLPVFYSDAFDYVENSAVLTEIYGAGATRTGTSVDAIDAPSGYGVFYAVYVPNSSVAGVASPKYDTATTVLTFVLEANSEASAEIKLDAAAQKTSSNIGGKFYCGSRESSDVTTDEATVGQTFTVPAAVPVEIAAAAADPVLTGLNTGCVDGDNGYVYGIPAGTTDFTTLFTVSNGTFEVTDLTSANKARTGATLTVKKTNGDVFATYTVIIFGDVNGDGAITSADMLAVRNAAQGSAIQAVNRFAANVNGDANVTSADMLLVRNAAQGSTITVNPYAS